jgi:hypothetical protein
MDEALRELLDTAVGEPPRQVTVEAVRRLVVRRRVFQTAGVSIVAVAVGFGTALSAGAIGTKAPGAVGVGTQHSGPPRYYVAEALGGREHGVSLTVRATSTGRLTAVVRDPVPGATCGGGNVGVAAADHQAFFMACSIWRSAPVSRSGPASRFRRPGKIQSIKSMIYRFTVTASGRVTGMSLVKGSMLNGWIDSIAAAPDGSQVAAEVELPHQGVIHTNSIPEGIFVISTRTGARALWGSGPYVRGMTGYSGASDISFTGNGRELVLQEGWCPRSRYLANCNGDDDVEVRAYAAAAGGSLEHGRLLLRPSELKPAGTSLFNSFITPDGSALNAVLATCPRRGPCTLSVVRMSVVTGRVLDVLYRTQTGSRSGGVFERFFSSDPSGRYLILAAGAGNARVNGWIDHGRMVPLVPASGNAASYETW